MDFIKALSIESEGQRVEFKAAFSTDLDEEIVAFANAESGSIFIGILEDGKIPGDNKKFVLIWKRILLQKQKILRGIRC